MDYEVAADKTERSRGPRPASEAPTVHTVAESGWLALASRLSGRRGWYSARSIAIAWGGILAALWAADRTNRLAAGVLALVVIGALQHRLFTVYHEAFHGALFRSRGANDFAGRWLAAYPSAVAYGPARERHLAHHRFAATDRDPERVSHLRSWRSLRPLMFPWPGVLATLAVRAGVPLSPPAPVPGRASLEAAAASPAGEIAAVVGVQAGLLLTFVAAFGRWGLLYHAALAIVNPTLAHVRQWVEHYDEDRAEVDPRYIVIRASPLEQFLFAPMNFNYHGPHHMYPGLPSQYLPEVAGLMKADEKPCVERAGYLSVISRNLPW